MVYKSKKSRNNSLGGIKKAENARIINSDIIAHESLIAIDSSVDITINTSGFSDDNLSLHGLAIIDYSSIDDTINEQTMSIQSTPEFNNKKKRLISELDISYNKENNPLVINNRRRSVIDAPSTTTPITTSTNSKMPDFRISAAPLQNPSVGAPIGGPTVHYRWRLKGMLFYLLPRRML